jgi:hypothetical protein
MQIRGQTRANFEELDFDRLHERSSRRHIDRLEVDIINSAQKIFTFEPRNKGVMLSPWLLPIQGVEAKKTTHRPFQPSYQDANHSGQLSDSSEFSALLEQRGSSS